MQEQSQQSEKVLPRVVMLLANSFEHDTRVYKEARSLIEWGCEVHIIAMNGAALPLEEDNGSIQIHRLCYRKGDSLRLGAIVCLWWCKPLARFALGSYRLTESADKDENQEDLSGKFSHRILSSLVNIAEKVPGVIRASNLVLRIIRRIAYLLRRCVKFVLRGFRRLAPSSLGLVALNLQFARKAILLKPDVVQSHDLNMLLGGAIVKRLSGVRLVYDSHELYLRRNIGNKSRAKDNIIWAPIERAFIGKCDAVLSVADGICEHLAKQYKIDKPHLIRNVQPYEPPHPKTTILANKLNIPREKKIVIYAGAVTINRGLEALIDSAAALENCVYVIMGYARNESYLKSLKKRASKRNVLSTKVFFHDAVPINEVTRYVASSDLGIVPTQNVCLSYFFESSNKIFHCMMAGVPLAMSDHYEKRLLVEQHDIGVLFDETNPADIARTVNNAIADEKRYNQMRQNCFSSAKKMNWEHEQHKLRNIYRELLGDRAPNIPEIMVEHSLIEKMSVIPAKQLLTS